jgi:hypothetical protein
MNFDSPTSMSVFESTCFHISLSSNLKIKKTFFIRGKVEFFGYHDKYNFIILAYDGVNQQKRHFFWSVVPLIQKNYPVGEMVSIFYDISDKIFENSYIFLIHSIFSLFGNTQCNVNTKESLLQM